MQIKNINLPKDYTPSDSEEYMNPVQLKFFMNKLQNWKESLINESQSTLQHLKEENLNKPDMGERASLETDTSLELRTRDRYRKLIDKIDAAMKRIENDSYGYCEKTGDPIGLKRLMARPIATLCIEAQEQHETHEKQHVDS